MQEWRDESERIGRSFSRRKALKSEAPERWELKETSKELEVKTLHEEGSQTLT